MLRDVWIVGARHPARHIVLIFMLGTVKVLFRLINIRLVGRRQ
jgi:hypothetical protein